MDGGSTVTPKVVTSSTSTIRIVVHRLTLQYDHLHLHKRTYYIDSINSLVLINLYISFPVHLLVTIRDEYNTFFFSIVFQLGERIQNEG